MSRRGDNQQRRWSAWGWGLSVLLSALSFSACIQDVVIPECLKDGTCHGGTGGDDDEPMASAGKVSSGVGGDVAVGGAVQGIGGAGVDAGAAGQGGELGDTCACTIVPAQLSPACVGKPYQATLTVGQGRAPYSWQLTPQPEGWTIAPSPDKADSAILRVEEAPAEATEVTLVVTDSRGAHRTLTLPLEVRTTCWFAYTSSGEIGPELRVVDPLADEPTPIPLTHARGAFDFKFSPDGAFLAYRYAPDQHSGRHLSLVDLTNLREHLVSFAEDELLYYSWAPSEAVLAVAFRKAGKTYLGAARAPALGSMASPSTLPSTVASVESELYWVGNDYVAFHAPDGVRRTPFFAEFTSAGFATPQDILRSFDVGVAVQPTDTGFFLITPEHKLYIDIADGVWEDVEHRAINLVGPSGRYTAALAANGLPRLFPAETADLGTIVEPADSAQTCTRLLAWATDRERIACVADVANPSGGLHGEVRIFDVNGDPARLDATTLGGFCLDDLDDTGTDSCLRRREGYSFGSTQAAGVPRAFSPSGRYFVFARALPGIVYVYLADLDATPVRVAEPKIFSVAVADASPLAFAFSPDERLLLVRRGPLLSAIDLTTRQVESLRNIEGGEPCTETFVEAPGAYCGNTTQVGAPIWAADSLATAYWGAEGLTIIDLSPFPTKSVKVLPGAACAGQCSGQFGFQP